MVAASFTDKERFSVSQAEELPSSASNRSAGLPSDFLKKPRGEQDHLFLISIHPNLFPLHSTYFTSLTSDLRRLHSSSGGSLPQTLWLSLLTPDLLPSRHWARKSNFVHANLLILMFILICVKSEEGTGTTKIPDRRRQRHWKPARSRTDSRSNGLVKKESWQAGLPLTVSHQKDD